jgi:hypothetical protein
MVARAFLNCMDHSAHPFSESDRRTIAGVSLNDHVVADELSIQAALAHGNLLRRRVTDFARQISEVIDQLDRPQKQQLLRLLIEDVHVTGWQVKIRLRVPLDPPDPGPTRPGPKRNAPLPTTRPTVSSQDRSRSADGHRRRIVPNAPSPSTRRNPDNQTLINPRGGDF